MIRKRKVANEKKIAEEVKTNNKTFSSMERTKGQ